MDNTTMILASVCAISSILTIATAVLANRKIRKQSTEIQKLNEVLGEWESPARISLQEKAAEVLAVPVALLSCKDGSVTPEEYDSAFGVQLELPIKEPKKPASVIENLQDYVLVTKEAYQALLEDQERLHQVQEAIGGWLNEK